MKGCLFKDLCVSFVSGCAGSLLLRESFFGCEGQGYSPLVVRSLLSAAVSLAVDHRL